MKLETLKEIMELLTERGRTRNPDQRPKSEKKKIRGDARDKKRMLRDEGD